MCHLATAPHPDDEIALQRVVEYHFFRSEECGATVTDAPGHRRLPILIFGLSCISHQAGKSFGSHADNEAEILFMIDVMQCGAEI